MGTYRPLYSLRVEHDYYDNLACRALAFRLKAGGVDLCRRRGLLFRQTAVNEWTLLYDCDSAGVDTSSGGVAGRNYNAFDAPVITACYWGDNGQEQGIGENQAGTGETKQVTDGLWQKAVTQMSAALQSAGSEWRYELTGKLPTLTKN